MPTTTTYLSFTYVSHRYNGHADYQESETDVSKTLLSEETVNSLIRLAGIVRPIYMRLLASGYNVRDGMLVKSEPKI